MTICRACRLIWTGGSGKPAPNGAGDKIMTILVTGAAGFIGFHLSHGAWSMFQSVGFSHPRYTPLIRRAAAVAAWILTAGFISVPVAVVVGLVR